jgi:uncharacterized membrane protein
MSTTRTLLAGEAWTALQFDLKGFDVFPRASYHEAIDPLRDALEGSGVDTDYLPDGRAATEFPLSVDELVGYDVVVLSDLGYNTLALPPAFTDWEGYDRL